MPNPQGLINGTKYLLLRENVAIGAIISQSSSFSRALVDITNKSSDQFRELLENEGTQTLDYNVECHFSNDAAFLALRDDFENGTISTYRLAIDGVAQADTFTAKIENFTDTSNLNESSKASFTIKSSSTFGDV